MLPLHFMSACMRLCIIVCLILLTFVICLFVCMHICILLHFSAVTTRESKEPVVNWLIIISFVSNRI